LDRPQVPLLSPSGTYGRIQSIFSKNNQTLRGLFQLTLEPPCRFERTLFLEPVARCFVVYIRDTYL